MRKYLFSASFALLVAATTVTTTIAPLPAIASSIKYVVNGIPVTTGDIQRRQAFMRLQHKKGDAANEMVEQALRMSEAKRLGMRISDRQVDEAYARFATSNKMQPKQLDGVLSQAGVTSQHFKDFIRSQMTWNQLLGARYRSETGGGPGGLSEQDAVRRMLDNGGSKPTATEYMLQQVIFVVPASERGAILGKRKREAEAMRGRFSGCATTREFAKGLVDVTVLDRGRVLAPQLPAEWADLIKKTNPGGATAVRETERGVEFFGVCSAREVSDDKTAQLVFQSEALGGGSGKGADGQADELSKKYMAELKQKAQIINR